MAEIKVRLDLRGAGAWIDDGREFDFYLLGDLFSKKEIKRLIAQKMQEKRGSIYRRRSK